jgi:hypothetical protein
MRTLHAALRSSLTFLALAAVACGGGANGTDGPRGPAGDQGAGGANGVAGATGPGGSAAPSATAAKPPRLLDDRLGGWKPTNRDRLDQLLTDYGVASATYDAKNPPIAIFDWDNTILKNDIGDATFFWMLKHDKVLQPPSYDWSSTSAFLSAAAKQALNTACDSLALPGQPLPTSTPAGVDCADAIVTIYDSETTPAGDLAWTTGEITSMTNNDYAWVAQLTAGYAPEEVRGFARAAYEENAFAPIGATQTVGDLPGYNGYVRIYEQMADLVGALQTDGFDVWITTASPQFFVDAISEATVGVKQSHVLGIRSMLQNGLVTTNLEGCGTIADAQNTMITFDIGKRCWINKVVYKEPVATQIPSNSNPQRRAVFVAGDSDTDVAFLKDGAVVKLVIDRHKMQIMCNALANYGNKWLIQDMFIAPKSPMAGNYACSAAKDHDGNPIVDEVGALIGDQKP